MRYAVFTDVHANLEALEAVLAKIDELAQQEPIDQIWFLGDLVGYGPNPNECIARLRERTDVIIAGNHDWAAVSKIDLDDFSTTARISAEWTTKQLAKEHYDFLANLPERLEIGECTLVHGSPYGPLWEYLTSEVLAERSFQYFTSRYCLVGHTHVPAIFQQPDMANVPTSPLGDTEQNHVPPTPLEENEEQFVSSADDETAEMMAVEESSSPEEEIAIVDTSQEGVPALLMNSTSGEEPAEATGLQMGIQVVEETTPEETIVSTEATLNNEIEELLTLLGLSRSMVQITNEMIVPHEGLCQVPEGYRAIINPGGVGQPRDSDPRAAFMIYDTERGFTFYRVPYAYEKTQEKIIKAGLPSYLAARLAYGR